MQMRVQSLGRSGLRVSELALGTMTFGEDWGWGANRKEAEGQFEAFVDAGGNFIDTANVYTGGTAERWVGELVSGDRDRFVIGTKFTLATSRSDPNRAGNQRKNMHRALRESLERLGTDHVDLFWVHMWDGVTPADEILRGLDDLVSRGLVHHVAISDAPAWVVAKLVTLSEEKGWAPPVAVQSQYALTRRTPERELLPMARGLELGVTAWGTLGRGILSGKYLQQPPEEGGTRRLDVQGGELTLHEREVAKEVHEVGAELDASPAQVATRWVLDRPGDVIPILGATRSAQLRDTLGALDLSLSEEHHERLEAASRIEMGFPTEFLDTPRIRGMIEGASLERRRDRPRPWR